MSSWVGLSVGYVDDQSNEIRESQELIELLDLADAVLTTDAMHCPTQRASSITYSMKSFPRIRVESARETVQKFHRFFVDLH
jgi:predicted transposase YbfD/YdcC